MSIVLLIVGGRTRVSAAELKMEDLYPADRVIQVEIEVAPEDWDTIRRQSREFFEVLGAERQSGPIESPYTYVPASVTIDGVKFPKVGIRKKGFIGSQSMTRPSLKVKLDFVDKKGEIDGVRVLTLNNNNQDASLLSQRVGYQVFRDAGLPASRCSYARVVVNGKNLGVYSHVESLKKPMLKRLFGSGGGVLYEGTIVDFHTGWENSFELKRGNDEKGRVAIKELIQLLNESSAYESSDFEAQLGEVVHLPSFYRFWAMESLLGFWDGYAGNSNNYFFYLSPKTDSFHFLPWGADSLFEEKSKFEQDPGAPLSVKTVGLLANRLYRTEFGRKGYRQALTDLLQHHWDAEALIAESRRLNDLVAPFVSDAQQKVDRASEKWRGFVRNRKQKLEAEIADGLPDWDRPPRPPVIVGEDGFGPKKKWKPGEKDLFTAVAKGNVKWIEKLVKSGVSIETTNAMGATPLGVAVLQQQTTLIKSLIELGADPNRIGPDGSAPIHGATFFGLETSVRALIENGVDLNVKNPTGQTPLDIASVPWNDDMGEMVKFMGMMLKIEVNEEAIPAGRPKLIAYLKENGAKYGKDVKTAPSNRLVAAIKDGSAEGVKVALARGGEVDKQDAMGLTPLSWAALHGDVAIVKLLLEAGADIDLANRDGGTPLHAAAFLGHHEVVGAMLDAGADREKKNGMGQTPIAGALAPWGPQVKSIAEMVGGMLQIEIDLEAMEAGRPKVVELLQAK